ncbi:MAG: 5-amino-6-(D-ribitylamino)uracil--L-tyrosine 4-hydroxyphenyl transferase CofH [Betaproteobacteria bacterium]|nr:MAG: 5-amino-6-(D-ribitylamino)uracil--L-tyrosine 4-hydroxyphenyl transferase CofH [Betaproteobacteria bacterium]
MKKTNTVLLEISELRRPSDDEVRRHFADTCDESLFKHAGDLRDRGHGNVISYSRKVFIPLTHLCRDVCHYCTFARTPRRGKSAFLPPERVLDIARAGERAGCHEALFTLGDKPELRYRTAQEQLQRLGHRTTLSYLAEMCEMLLRETSLLPHINPGVMSRDEVARLRQVSVSQGIMLENVSQRLCEKGGPHFGSPDKLPEVRLQTMRHAGALSVPFTSGILIGIGETRQERIDSLLAIRELHERYGHIQEVIIQNFRAKRTTKMAHAPEPDLSDLMWTLGMARVIFGPSMNLQVPPNLTPEEYPLLVSAGLNDWGGVSPVTPDHVNPEMPWPQINRLRKHTEQAGKELVERLAIYPGYCLNANNWLDATLVSRVNRAVDTEGFARNDAWSPGTNAAIPKAKPASALCLTGAAKVDRILSTAAAGNRLAEDEIVSLFSARGSQFQDVCAAANELRERTVGDIVRYVVNRNINYTNICSFHCTFCAFSKGKAHAHLRGQPYDITIDEVVRRAREAHDRGATEVCMQGGIHPDYTGETYLALCRAVKAELPDLHIHAFSPLEIKHGASTLGVSVEQFLGQLRDAGLGTLPGTAAEILDDEVRAVICPDKLSTDEWLSVSGTAHQLGLKTTATIMFGHVERYKHWARHLLRVRELQEQTGGFTEFVPLPFVHMEAPMYLHGQARKGPTFRETVLMHAAARLVLHPLIPNIQASWVKLGKDAVRACLRAGVNDLGGTLMNESISRAAGTLHGQEMAPGMMDALITKCGRIPKQRTTLYAMAPRELRERSYRAIELSPLILSRAKRTARAGSARAAAVNSSSG